MGADGYNEKEYNKSNDDFNGTGTTSKLWKKARRSKDRN